MKQQADAVRGRSCYSMPKILDGTAEQMWERLITSQAPRKGCRSHTSGGSCGGSHRLPPHLLAFGPACAVGRGVVRRSDRSKLYEGYMYQSELDSQYAR